ncbi:hypothetical protein [Microbacterium sp. NPDC096154]|uniref:hypothetical protein n=1 Tax=Microbacterium sp. NPDC096154 TaxID=3155549 RepID=UPI003326FF2A
MTELDLFTASFMTAVVVIAAGVVFLLETVVRRDSGPGRYWAASFLCGILVTFCSIIWVVDPGLWVAVALGNGAFVAHMGLMWLGCRVYNARSRAWAHVLVAAGAICAFAAAVMDRGAGDWAGAPAMFIGICAFAVLGAIETLRGALHEVFASRGLTFVLGAAALYYAGRTIAFLVAGPESALFQDWFGTNMTSLVVVALTIVAVVTTSVLRVVSATARQSRTEIPTGALLLPSDFFMIAIADVAGRSERAGAPMTVVAVRVEGVGDIAAAFGAGTAELVEHRWRDAVHRHLPILSPAGALDDSTVAFVLDVATAEEVGAIGNELRQGLIDDLATQQGAVLPAIGVGFALAQEHGYDADRLAEAALEAACRSARSSGMPVVQATR